MVTVMVSLLFLAALTAAAMFAGTSPTALDEELACAGETRAYKAAHARWRALSRARDWDSLHAQVRRWQELATPGWSESEIEQVARSLNRAVFRFAEPLR